MALSLKEVLPLFNAIEAVQLTALRYVIRKPHGLNLPRALKRGIRPVKAALRGEA